MPKGVSMLELVSVARGPGLLEPAADHGREKRGLSTAGVPLGGHGLWPDKNGVPDLKGPCRAALPW